MEFDHQRLHVHAADCCSTQGPFTCRYYVSARGSATESAALLDVCFRLKLIAEEQHRTGKEILWRIVAMLVKLAEIRDFPGPQLIRAQRRR
jgi:hypothetical protein